jgi:hypothetical protein
LIDEVIVELEARRAALHEAVDRIHASKQEVSRYHHHHHHHHHQMISV